ncbi:MAG: hypothetical protein AAB263_13005 [Planctomycetota bacterium]
MTRVDRIRQAARRNDRSLRLDYSGRGMFGAQCLGIVCDDPEDVIAEVGVKGARTDSMGKSVIVYWPSITAPLDGVDG